MWSGGGGGGKAREDEEWEEETEQTWRKLEQRGMGREE